LSKPFINWPGNKTETLSIIRAKYPRGLGKSITKYAEPFVGGGAVLFDILNSYDLEAVYISDTCHELIEAYENIRDNVYALIDRLNDIQKKFNESSLEGCRLHYALLRDNFNARIGSSVEMTALLIALNCACRARIFRVFSDGKIQAAIREQKNYSICDEKNLEAVSRKLKDVKIVCCDYRQSRSFIDNKTFAYFDPPYRLPSRTARMKHYMSKAFGDKKQVELARYIDELSDMGAYIITSNSDPQDDGDDFFERLYRKYNITHITVDRTINSTVRSRSEIDDLLIANF
jgi:DNA adenine methylase